MNISRFFIDRPIFAAVLSLFIFIAGLLSIWKLPVSEYPEVVPPSVIVTAFYPGANPQTIAETVAAPIEEQINGVEGMLYMFSQGSSDGSMKLSVTFKIGTDPDKAQQLVQNRVNQALPRLPDVVRQIGVTTIKSSSDITLVVHLLSPNERYDNLYLGNYALLNIKDRLTRIPGVGQVLSWGGSDYAMRVWLDPHKIAARGLNANDVVSAIREQNIQVAAGIIGAAPNANVDLQLNINAQGRLQSEDDFGNIIIKTSENGAVTKLKDIASIELGASHYALRSYLNNKPAIALGVFQSPGSNTIEISNKIRETMENLKRDFPEDMDYSIVYDPTNFVRDSIKAVVHTLFEAIALVVLVVILFLQTWRASIIPLLAVPVSIIGTFALLYLFGFSINALSLFGLVLAIGIVVDDAIVVVENVERNIEAGLTPKEATYKAMREVSGPIIAIGLTLIAVFVPIAFISGLNGEFYRQFALTIAISTIISTINSLTLSPAMAALLLKSHDAPKDKLTLMINGVFGPIFKQFNRLFKRSNEAYQSGIGHVLKRKTLSICIYLFLINITVYAFSHVPTGYIPQQDKQFLIGFAQLPDAASLDRTDEVIKRMSDILLNTPGVEDAVSFAGLSINGFTPSSSAGVIFVTLKPFSERQTSALSTQNIAQSINGQLREIKDAFVMVLPPPPILGLGTLGGFKLQIQDRADFGDDQLFKVIQAIQAKAWQTPELANVFSGFQINVPQLKVDIDKVKAKQLGIPISHIYDTMQIYLGSLYINDFNKFGRTYRVIAQAEAPFRARAEDIAKLQVRNVKGEMVPLGSVIHVSQSYGPERAMRYNGYRSAEINGAPAPGYSSGQAERAMEKILQEILPKGMSYEWTELTYQKILAGNTAIIVFPLCVLLVFLVLAAQYESLVLPLVIILIVPMSLLCAIFGVWLMGGDNNIFTQVGLFVLVGLACKNAILIVEFARELEIEGLSPIQAAMQAAKLRLRPILMTSFAFIMGVIPLVLSTGAGAEMRHAMGIAVFFGMLGVTFFGLFLTPVFYVLMRTLLKVRLTKKKADLSHQTVYVANKV
jgi:multidrug efflux pump